MRRIYIDAFLGGGADPPVAEPAARENERNVFTGHVDDGQLQVDVKGCGGYSLPHLSLIARPENSRFDLDHFWPRSRSRRAVLDERRRAS